MLILEDDLVAIQLQLRSIQTYLVFHSQFLTFSSTLSWLQQHSFEIGNPNKTQELLSVG